MVDVEAHGKRLAMRSATNPAREPATKTYSHLRSVRRRACRDVRSVSR